VPIHGGERERRSGHQVMTMYYTHIRSRVKQQEGFYVPKPLLCTIPTLSYVSTSVPFGVAAAEQAFKSPYLR
jgi:hypothetical protein